jgi:hypothetical protein
MSHQLSAVTTRGAALALGAVLTWSALLTGLSGWAFWQRQWEQPACELTYMYPAFNKVGAAATGNILGKACAAVGGKLLHLLILRCSASTNAGACHLQQMHATADACQTLCRLVLQFATGPQLCQLVAVTPAGGVASVGHPHRVYPDGVLRLFKQAR